MAHTRNFSAIREAIEAHLEQQSQWHSQWKQENLRFVEQLQQQRLTQPYDSQTKKEKGSQIGAQSKMPTQLEAAKKGKKVRSYALLSTDDIFAKWEKGLCELCDEFYSPGHKCKKVSSDYVVIVVDEEEDVRQPDFEVEDPPAVDAHQVLDESPKSNPDISSDVWVGEGQGKTPVGSQNTVCEQLDGLNPSNGLLEQTDLCVQEELGEDAKSGIGMEQELPMLAGYSKALGLKSVVPELKDPNLPVHRVPKYLGWKEAIDFCELVYDPGILRPGPSTLQPDIIVFNSVLTAFVPSHQWKAVSWVLEQLKKGGYEGIKVIGQCYEMLLTPSAPRMEGGWLTAPLYCSRWKTLKLYGRAETSPSQRRTLLHALFADIAREIDDRATDTTLFRGEKKCWFHGWKEANGFCLLVFDPGKSGVGQGTPKPTSLAFMYAWLGEIFAASKLSVVRLGFDPRETILYAWLGEIFSASKLSVVRLVFDPGVQRFVCQKSTHLPTLKWNPFHQSRNSTPKMAYSGEYVGRGSAGRGSPASDDNRTASRNGMKSADTCLVWGKAKSHPWWPGHIYNEAFASSSVRRTKRDGHVWVAFLGVEEVGDGWQWAKAFLFMAFYPGGMSFILITKESIGTAIWGTQSNREQSSLKDGVALSDFLHLDLKWSDESKMFGVINESQVVGETPLTLVGVNLNELFSEGSILVDDVSKALEPTGASSMFTWPPDDPQKTAIPDPSLVESGVGDGSFDHWKDFRSSADVVNNHCEASTTTPSSNDNGGRGVSDGWTNFPVSSCVGGITLQNRRINICLQEERRAVGEPMVGGNDFASLNAAQQDGQDIHADASQSKTFSQDDSVGLWNSVTGMTILDDQLLGSETKSPAIGTTKEADGSLNLCSKLVVDKSGDSGLTSSTMLGQHLLYTLGTT